MRLLEAELGSGRTEEVRENLATPSPYPVTSACSEVQKAQRVAALGMSLRHSLQGRTSESGSGARRVRSLSALYGFTMKKNTAAPVETNVTTLFMKSP